MASASDPVPLYGNTTSPKTSKFFYCECRSAMTNLNLTETVIRINMPSLPPSSIDLIDWLIDIALSISVIGFCNGRIRVEGKATPSPLLLSELRSEHRIRQKIHGADAILALPIQRSNEGVVGVCRGRCPNGTGPETED